ncbi:MAG: hypothetical protein ACI9MR_003174, partial [Myxococcota bacterium]
GVNAFFIDAYSKTSDSTGKALSRAKIDGKRQKIRTPDGIHLTTKAVEALMADPIMAHILPCIAKPEPKVAPVPKTAKPAAKDDAKTEVVTDTKLTPAGG